MNRCVAEFFLLGINYTKSEENRCHEMLKTLQTNLTVGKLEWSENSKSIFLEESLAKTDDATRLFFVMEMRLDISPEEFPPPQPPSKWAKPLPHGSIDNNYLQSQ